MLNGGKKIIIPSGYKSSLSIRDTAKAIKIIKDFFELELAKALNLERVSAPLFVRPESGMNDNLSGVERPVSFNVKAINENIVEIVHSLAKWKRMALKRYEFSVGEGLYTDMNAIRRDEELGNLHSIYVDQWDWEVVISKEDRKIEVLKETVKKIYNALKKTEDHICSKFPVIKKTLPDEIYFITTQELEDMYPDLSPVEREDKIAKEKSAVFIMKIGGILKSGIKHGERAPDYDDWNLNGDILLWYPLLDRAMEISSMGIRVDEEALLRQLKEAGCEDRKNLLFHRELLEGRLPYTIGGGIGQSRMCMYLLKKAHIGEVQASVWPDSMIEICDKANIKLL
ncbi:aspartate--ammonia ligase [Acetivibrio saccincola]|uniref:Aspartate--ammonia ligase n=1 Tax=Acetivibrio saccincola TaxID=1677857 RepID=A0A2K9EKA4_9FIRM|nr:aspartate--ammonia ligase [Acetivibrio saccincola]AUG56991.1 Aspartate--ammonia ligase [Acetivibrio saccincola]